MSTPNVTSVSGSYNTGIDNANVFVRDVDPMLYYLDPHKYPLVSVLFTMGTELDMQDDGEYTLKGSNSFKQLSAKNVKFEHDESERLKFAFNPTAAVATGDSSITVSSSDSPYFVAGSEILLVNAAGSREVARVTAVASTSLTVTRNIGSTGAIALTTADFFYNMGVIRAEDSVSTTPVQAKSDTLYNYCEFISEPYGVTNIQRATANYHGDPYERAKMEAFDRMRRNLEIMFWFGVRSQDSGTTNPIYHNGGIMYWLENQFTDVPVLDAGGVLTKQVFDQFLIDVMKYSNTKKVIFCSSPVLTAISGFAANNLRISDVNTKRFGMAISEYFGPHGSVILVREPLFDEISSMNGSAVVLDMNNVTWRYLEGNGVNLNLKSYDDIQENDRAGRKGEWKGVGGVDIKVGKSHGILKNVLA